MDEQINIGDFDAVWRRVTDITEPPPPLPEAAPRPEERLCLVKRAGKSCAVRFLPRF